MQRDWYANNLLMVLYGLFIPIIGIVMVFAYTKVPFTTGEKVWWLLFYIIILPTIVFIIFFVFGMFLGLAGAF